MCADVVFKHNDSSVSSFLQISSAVIFCLCSMSLQQTASILVTQRRDTVKGM